MCVWVRPRARWKCDLSRIVLVKWNRNRKDKLIPLDAFLHLPAYSFASIYFVPTVLANQPTTGTHTPVVGAIYPFLVYWWSFFPVVLLAPGGGSRMRKITALFHSKQPTDRLQVWCGWKNSRQRPSSPAENVPKTIALLNERLAKNDSLQGEGGEREIFRNHQLLPISIGTIFAQLAILLHPIAKRARNAKFKTHAIQAHQKCELKCPVAKTSGLCLRNPSPDARISVCLGADSFHDE